MSDRRDLIWFRSATATHFTGTIAAGSLSLASITANATNHIRGGDVPLADAHTPLNGRIEAINVKLLGTVVPLDIVFFAAATANETGLDDDRYIEHESFVATDYFTIGGESPSVSRGAISGISIPYYDEDRSKTFHIGVRNAGATNTSGPIVVEWAWRPDLGESL